MSNQPTYPVDFRALTWPLPMFELLDIGVVGRSTRNGKPYAKDLSRLWTVVAMPPVSQIFFMGADCEDDQAPFEGIYTMQWEQDHERALCWNTYESADAAAFVAQGLPANHSLVVHAINFADVMRAHGGVFKARFDQSRPAMGLLRRAADAAQPRTADTGIRHL